MATPSASQLRRYTDFPFPPYSYVTGRFPHPLREPGGHGCPGPSAESAPDGASSEIGLRATHFLWGLDLYHAGFYWEAHEAWEHVWHRLPRRGDAAQLIQGLIKLAAAGVKAREGREAGVVRHALRAGQLFSAVASGAAHEGAAGHAFVLTLPHLLDVAATTAQRASAITAEAVRDITAPVLPRLDPPSDASPTSSGS